MAQPPASEHVRSDVGSGSQGGVRPEPRRPPSTTASPSDEPLDTAIVELLHLLGTQMHALGSRFAAAQDLHVTDVQALSALAMAGGRLTAGELAAALELSTGATTRLVDRLERVGHVARHADDQDRRRRHVAITPDAASTAGAFFGSVARTVEDVLGGFDRSERETLRRFLVSMTSSLDEQGRDEVAVRAPRTPNGPAEASSVVQRR